MDTDELSEVKITAQLRNPPAEENLPEIVSEGTRIPWWLWAVGGALVAVVFLHKDSSR